MSACTLQFAKNSPLRTTLVDETTGHTKFQIDTPIRIVGSVTRIRKFDLPPQSPLVSNDKASSDFSDNPTDLGGKKKGGFEWKNLAGAELPKADDEIGRIRWKCFSSDGFDFGGKVATQKEFLPKCGKMKNSFKFTGPDGVEYRWALGAMGMNYPRLVTTDGKKTEIAKFHRASCFPRKRKARLEVQPAGMGMLDHIVLTFVYAEQKRRERESAAKSGGG